MKVRPNVARRTQVYAEKRINTVLLCIHLDLSPEMRAPNEKP